MGYHSLLQETLLIQGWDQTLISCIAGRFFTLWATRKAQMYTVLYVNYISIKLEKTRKLRQDMHRWRTMWGHGKKTASCNPSRDLRRNQTYKIMISCLQNCDKINFWCLSHPSVIFCYGSSSNWTNLRWRNWLPMWKQNEIGTVSHIMCTHTTPDRIQFKCESKTLKLLKDNTWKSFMISEWRKIS